VLNNLFLSTGAGVVLLGTFFPLITEAFGQPLTVGKPYFDATFLPFMVPLLLLMALGPFVQWKQHRGGVPLRGLSLLLGLALVLTALVSLLLLVLTLPRLSLPVMLGLFLGGWLLGGGLLTFIQRARRTAGSPLRLRLSLSAWSVSLAHAGLGIAVFGMIAGSAMVQERTLNLKPGESATVGHLTFRLDAVREQPADPSRGRNYISAFADLSLIDAAGQARRQISPERRFYPVRQDSTTEAAIRTTWLGDVFVAFNTQAPDGGTVLTLSWRPLIPWLWAGALLMVAGGLLGMLAALRRSRRTGP
jgi:cytochrome c-type biogenesis protein CcmF